MCSWALVYADWELLGSSMGGRDCRLRTAPLVTGIDVYLTEVVLVVALLTEEAVAVDGATDTERGGNGLALGMADWIQAYKISSSSTEHSLSESWVAPPLTAPTDFPPADAPAAAPPAAKAARAQSVLTLGGMTPVPTGSKSLLRPKLWALADFGMLTNDLFEVADADGDWGIGAWFADFDACCFDGCGGGRMEGRPLVIMSSRRPSSLPSLSSLKSADWNGCSGALAAGILSVSKSRESDLHAAASDDFLSSGSSDWAALRPPEWTSGDSFAVLITSPSMCSELRLVQRVRAGLSSSWKGRI